MSAPLRAVVRTEVQEASNKWQKDFVSPEERTDPYKAVAFYKLSVDDAIEQAMNLLKKHGYQVIPRVRK